MQTIRKIRHPSRDFTVPIVVAKIPIGVAIPGSDGGDCFHGSKKHSSLPPAAARLLKGCNSSLYRCFFLPYDGNGCSNTVLDPTEMAFLLSFCKDQCTAILVSCPTRRSLYLTLALQIDHPINRDGVQQCTLQYSPGPGQILNFAVSVGI